MNKHLRIMVIAVMVFIGGAVGITALLLKDNPEQSLSVIELLDLGDKYLLELNYEQALVQFTKVIEVEPMNVRAYLGGTDVYLHFDRTQDAIDLLKAGINATDNKNLSLVLIGVEKSVIEGYIALAEAYEVEGLYEKALELLQRVYDETGDEIIGRKLGIVQASEIVFRDDYVIEWKDPAFENLIRQYLGKENGGIRYNDVKMIEKIEIWGQIIAMQDEEFEASYSEERFWISDDREGGKNGEIKSLADLEHFTSLKDLTVSHQVELDISALADVDTIDCLKRIAHLNLTSDGLTDISVFSNLIALNSLSVNYNDIADISPISMLIELSDVALGQNENITSAEPLRGLRKLSSIDIDSADLSIFIPLPELKDLNIFGADDWSVLPKLQTLEYLEITATDENFQYIIQLSSLTTLRLHGRGLWNDEEMMWTGGLTNISGIDQLSNLTGLDLLVSNCYDISPLTSLNIEQLELELPSDCDLTPLTQISTLQKVIVPDDSGLQSGDDDKLIDKVRAILPDIEVAIN